ncbi:hypothetical protein [Streptomyces sp. NPDC014733]|uniref:hypothetical protein n=1 Tax=Streptomyces sp. NPDC014733 TaxID=3364885 RepID=UPI0036F50D79
MGIENDQLVFDYLSRVGDLAQQRGLPSSARMRLVADLRTEVTARIAAQKSPSASQVKRVLSRLGTPEAVVSAAEAAAGTSGRPGPGAGREPTRSSPAAGASVPDASSASAAPSAPVMPTAPAVPAPPDVPVSPAAPSAPDTPPAPAPAPAPAPPSPSTGPSALDVPSARPGTDDAPGPTDAPEPPDAFRPAEPSGLAREEPHRPLSLGKPGAAGEPGQAGAAGKVPGPRDGARSGQWSGLFKKKGAEAGEAEAAGPRFTLPPGASAPPHLAGADELGDGDGDADWWLARPEATGVGETVPGFVGGIEIPEIWKRPGEDDDREKAQEKEKAQDGTPGAGAAGTEAGRPLPGLLRRTLGRKKAAPAAEPPAPEPAAEKTPAARIRLSPVVTLAVVLLLAGAVLGSWFALAAGWAVTFLSRRLTHTEAKFAALGVPGLLAGGAAVWMWGRATGRWGDPIASGKMGAVLLDGLPLLVRVAAVASAVFLVWRMRRWAR